MNMKTMLAGWKGVEMRSKLQPFVGFSDFYCSDGLAYAKWGNEVHFYFVTGSLRPCAYCQCHECQSKTLHVTSWVSFCPLSLYQRQHFHREVTF
jgi:hypothetical protein